MVRQIVQKFISPFGGFDRHLGPEARRVRFSAAQVLDPLPEHRRGSFEPAHQVADEVIRRAHGKDVDVLDGKRELGPFEAVVFLAEFVILNGETPFQQGVVDGLVLGQPFD